MASVHKFIVLMQRLTTKQVMEELKEVIKREGKEAEKWPVCMMDEPEEDKPSGIDTGQAASFPSISDSAPALGFKQGKR